MEAAGNKLRPAELKRNDSCKGKMNGCFKFVQRGIRRPKIERVFIKASKDKL